MTQCINDQCPFKTECKNYRIGIGEEHLMVTPKKKEDCSLFKSLFDLEEDDVSLEEFDDNKYYG